MFHLVVVNDECAVQISRFAHIYSYHDLL